VRDEGEGDEKVENLRNGRAWSIVRSKECRYGGNALICSTPIRDIGEEAYIVFVHVPCTNAC
jgi:hypothetical protein